MEKEKEAKNPTDVIILNRMYAGEYLGENLGHEVINLIKPDESEECNSYLVYITNDGKIKDKFHKEEWKASCVLYTRWCKREYKDDNNQTKTLSMQEILAKTEGKLVNLIDDYKNNKKNKEYTKIHLKSLEKYTYDGKGLEEIFSKNKHVTQPILYATFEVDKIIKVKPEYRVFIVDDKETWEKCREINNNNEEENSEKKEIQNPKEEFIYINEDVEPHNKLNFSSRSLKQYVVNGMHNNKNLEQVYNNIKNKIIKGDFWAKGNENPVRTYKELKDANLIVSGVNKNNFIGIIRQEYDELTYTNLFFHIFKSSPELFCEFANEVLKIKTLSSSDNLRFVREEGNIDLLIDDMENKTLIVIENKIKSGINGVRHDEAGEEVGNQLSKYIHYTFGYVVDKGSDKNGYTYKRLKSEIDDNDEERESNGYENYKDRHFFIFAPKYKNFKVNDINSNVHKFLIKKSEYKEGTDTKLKDIEGVNIDELNYKIIDYKKIFDFFNKKERKEKYQSKIEYYDEFLYAIDRHSNDTDNIQERQMYERFAQRIEELPPPKKKRIRNNDNGIKTNTKTKC